MRGRGRSGDAWAQEVLSQDVMKTWDEFSLKTWNSMLRLEYEDLLTALYRFIEELRQKMLDNDNFVEDDKTFYSGKDPSYGVSAQDIGNYDSTPVNMQKFNQSKKYSGLVIATDITSNKGGVKPKTVTNANNETKYHTMTPSERRQNNSGVGNTNNGNYFLWLIKR